MPSDERNTYNPPPQQSIPLQDLSRPPDDRSDNAEWGSSRSLSSFRSRALLGSRRPFSGRVNTQGRYERVLAGTSSDTGNSRLDVPHITTPRTAHQPPAIYDDGELSPVDVGDFQAALGGLDLGPPTSEPSATFTPGGGNRLNPIHEDTPTPSTSFPTPNEGDDEEYFTSRADDRAPLTDTRYLQPISGSQLPDASGQRHDRNHRRAPSYTNRMLGDDLPDRSLTVGSPRRSLNRMSSLSIPSLSRSLSTGGSPLGSAGHMLRKMSQRVVNLSNEPEPIEPSIRRQATLEAPPSFPAMTEYVHDDLPDTPGPLEKAPPLTHVGMPRHKWQQQTNPLKGHTLEYFGPDNRLRLWLCEVLVHPVTEPIILILILIQTVLLAVDAGSTMEYGKRTQGWGNTYADIAQVVLFILYSLEIAARMIVSGFVKNAYEYSTLPKGQTVFKAFVAILQSLWTPNRDSDHHVKMPGMGNVYVQNSIFKTFTSIQNPEERGHGRQAQRIRLARRAFLRHSFNRLDFLAVISFWISFVLSVTNQKAERHLYVFQMLSALRILRLLSLTSGTSVSFSSHN